MCTLINLYNEWKNTKSCALSQFLCEQLCVSPLANVRHDSTGHLQWDSPVRPDTPQML